MNCGLQALSPTVTVVFNLSATLENSDYINDLFWFRKTEEEEGLVG